MIARAMLRMEPSTLILPACPFVHISGHATGAAKIVVASRRMELDRTAFGSALGRAKTRPMSEEECPKRHAEIVLPQELEKTHVSLQ
jgi:hypothetical protein